MTGCAAAWACWRAEVQVAYPSARLSAACEGPDAVRAMGEDMAGRRGVCLLR